MSDVELSLGATSQLYWEHRVIEAVATCARRFGPVADATPETRADFDDFFGFFATYVDAWHFGNEETFFVPVLRTMGFEGALRAVERITTEHLESRAAFDELKAGYRAALTGDAAAVASFDAGLQKYVDLTVAHLTMEDRYLYAMLQRALSSPAQRHLSWVLRHEHVNDGRAGLPFEQEETAQRLCARHGVAFPEWDRVMEGLETQDAMSAPTP